MLYQAHFREVLWATGPTLWKELVCVILAMLLVQDFAFGNPEEQTWDIHTTNAHIFAVTLHYFLFYTSISNDTKSSNTMKPWNAAVSSGHSQQTSHPQALRGHRWPCNPHGWYRGQWLQQAGRLCPLNCSQPRFSAAFQHWALSWQNHHSAHHSTLPFLPSPPPPPAWFFYSLWLYLSCYNTDNTIAWHTEGNLSRGNKAF